MALRRSVVACIGMLLVAGCGTAQSTSAPKATSTGASSPASSSATTEPAPPSASTAAASTPATAPTLALPASVEVAGTELTDSERAAMMSFATDVLSGDSGALATSCWTRPASWISDHYVSAQAAPAVLEALTHPPTMSQGGATWTGTAATVMALWPELDSPYACPDTTVDGVSTAVTSDEVRLHLQRLVARADGTPIHASDTEANYPLICGPEPYEGGPTNVSLPLLPAQLSAIRTLASAQLELSGDPLAPVAQSAGTANAVSAEFHRNTGNLCLAFVNPG